MLSALQVFSRYSISPFTNPDFCTTTFPTAWFTSSFSISELTNNGNFGFRKNQSNRTLILGFSNTNFSFNPGIGSITATGTEVTINAYTITSSSIIVNITVSSSNKELNTINFSNFQVRATAAGTSMIRRTGGTFSIDNSTGTPPPSVSWGMLSAGTPYYYSMNTTAQTGTTDVFVNSTGNLIIRTQVVIAGTCGSSLAATAFHFNTAGSGLATQNPGTNLGAARLYYTGTSTVFATSDLYGSVNNPAGSFTINGNQAFLTAGTYNFWLTYDILATANNGDLVDAQFVAVEVSGNVNAAVSGNPAGSRTINNKVFYTRDANAWSNSVSKWSTTPGGTACACTPVAGSGVYISHPTLLDLNSPLLTQVNILNNGALTDANNNLAVSDVLSTSGSGYFQATNSWSLRHLVTNGTGLSASSKSLHLTGNITIGGGTTLQFTGGPGQDLIVDGDILISGILNLGTSNGNSSNTLGTSIAGTGTVSGTGTITLGVDKSIASDARLSIAPALVIGSGIIITNYGHVNMQNSINGSGPTSRWVNEVNSALSMGGSGSSLMSTGILDASAAPNTVAYSGSAAQAIKIALNSNYHHLQVTNAGTKSLGAAILISGNITLGGSAQLSSGAVDISLLGNWINHSTNASPFSSTGTIYFFGNNDSIQGTGITTFNHINIQPGSVVIANPLAGKVIVNGNWINDGDFDHNSSDVIFNGTSQISGLSTTVFYNLIVNSGKTLVLHTLETDFQGSITANGTISHNSALALFNGNGNIQTLSAGASGLTFHQFEIDNPSGSVVLSSPVTVNNQLTLSNGLVTSSSANILRLIAGASATSGTTTSFVNGPMEKAGTTAFVFPVGKGSRWARLGIGAPTSGSTFRAEYFDTPYANTTSTASTPTPVLNNVSKLEYWQLDRTAGTGNAIVTLHWEDASWSGINDCSTNDLRIAHWNGSAWENNNDVVTTSGSCTGATPGSISTAALVTAFSPFTFGSKTSGTMNVLPVEMVEFSGTCNQGRVLLKWATASEQNNSHFSLERSPDGLLWQDVGVVKAPENGRAGRIYNFADPENPDGIVYYRITQVDIDGKMKTYRTIYVDCKNVPVSALKIYPSPASGHVRVELQVQKNYGTSQLEVRDNAGRTCLIREIVLNEGENSFELPFSLAPGLYQLLISQQGMVFSAGKLLVR